MKFFISFPASTYYLTLVVTLAVVEIVNGAPPPQFSEVEQHILDARRKVSDYHIRLLITDETKEKGEKNSITKLAFDMMRENNKLKVYKYSGHSFSSGETVAEVVCVNCEYPNTCFNYSSQPVENGEIGLAFYELKDRVKFDLRNPLKIGLIPLGTGFFHAFNSESFLTAPDRTEKKIERVNYKGAECYKLTWKDKQGKYTVYVDYSKSYNIVKWICDAPGNDYHASVDIELSDYSDSGLWLPKQVVFKSTNAKTEYTEKVDIETISINKPLASNTFSLKGIEFLPKSTAVIWASSGPSPFGSNNFWDGEKLISISPIEKIIPKGAQNQNYTLFLIYINIAAILLFIGIRILIKKTKK